ncbi:hypothetical protein D0864_00306 [Hortaea werneckii]|uniref:Uncharacterized protein n=1 Tax=Hortaea werneckii TaxID=91943 RepID=A0A3M7HL91_HORWE|nr:hypothetical protein KC317_g14648 [Hortaea werneckii]KAI7675454.1 hypothetical protein KC322_g15493 [Hortaea werneckii]RMZ13937.1 hypothetical protein D0864_00306 [Hortaea werneckii]
MDHWQAIQNWGMFLVVGGAIGAYYYSQNKPQTPTASNRRRSVQEPREPKEQRPKAKRRENERPSAETSAAEVTSGPGKENNKKRKAPSKPQQRQHPTAPAVPVSSQEDDKEDQSTRQFAEQLAKARKGTDLSVPKGKEQKLKTVKQGSVKSSAPQTSEQPAQADDDMSPSDFSAINAGDVSDMLEPKASGPSTIRVTAPSQPQKDKAPKKQKKEEPVETKKQRQNRLKKEEQRLVREAEEKERKVLEEKQRRAAREARGEPARNGMGVKPPTSNAWNASKPSQPATVTTAPAVNGTPLLDTFDAESTASSNGGLGGSTAATSTTDADTLQQRARDDVSEEEQMAQVMRESGDDSGWTTVAQPKKQKGKKHAEDGEVNGVSTPTEPVPAPAPKPAPVSKPAPAPAKPAMVNGKPKGFQALTDEYEQRTNVDPNDASNWDA